MSISGLFSCVFSLLLYTDIEFIALLPCSALLPHFALFSLIMFMIGVFDSGLGGLTVLKEIRRVLPEYDYMYLGDTLHVPYGNRSDEAVYNLTKKACEYLFSQGCKLIILACNTATAKALRRLQKEYLPARSHFQMNRVGGPSLTPAFPRSPSPFFVNILGVVRPMAEYVGTLGRRNIGVIGTRGTVNSKVYVVELKGQRSRGKGQKQGQDINSKNKNPQTGEGELQVFQQACPLLVPLIEEGWQRSKEIDSILNYYLEPLRRAKVEILVLGCTHYPLLLNQIKKIMGPRCFIPNPGSIVAKSLRDYLSRHDEIRKQLTRNSKVKYFVTDLNENFEKVARRFIGKKIQIKLVKY